MTQNPVKCVFFLIVMCFINTLKKIKQNIFKIDDWEKRTLREVH